MTDTPDIETRVRALIKRIESISTYEDHQPEHWQWFNCGMDDAYDNVIDWLYYDVLQEER